MVLNDLTDQANYKQAGGGLTRWLGKEATRMPPCRSGYLASFHLRQPIGHARTARTGAVPHWVSCCATQALGVLSEQLCAKQATAAAWQCFLGTTEGVLAAVCICGMGQLQRDRC